MVLARAMGPRLSCQNPSPGSADSRSCMCIEDRCCVVLDADIIALVNFERFASTLRGPLGRLLGRQDPARCDCLIVYRLPDDPGSVRVASVELKGRIHPEPAGPRGAGVEKRVERLARSLAWKHATCLGLAARALHSLPRLPTNVVYECYTFASLFNPAAPIVPNFLVKLKEEARRAFEETLRRLGLEAGSVKCRNFDGTRLFWPCCSGLRSRSGPELS